MHETAVVCRNLGFSYPKVGKVLEGISFEIPLGQRVGLLGPNGAGKTTLVRPMVGLMPPTEGTVRTFGQDTFRQSQARRLIGVMHQSPGLEEFLSGWDNLFIYGRFLGLTARKVSRRVEEIGERFGSTAYLKQEVISLSGGQRRRLQLTRALLHRPRLLFLDEPTVALDVDGRQQFYHAFGELVSELGTTVVWTSHYLEEIERNCQRVIILKEGKVALDQSTQSLVDVSSVEKIIVTLAPGSITPPPTPELERAGADQLVYKGSAELFYREVLPRLTAAGTAIVSVHQTKPSLEEIYLQLVRTKEGVNR